MRKFNKCSSKRRKQEEEENQRVYEEFVKSFNEDSSSSMTFVRGGVQNASSSKTSQNVIFFKFRVSTPHISLSVNSTFILHIYYLNYEFTRPINTQGGVYRMDAQRGTKRKSYDMMNAFVTAAQASVSSSTPSPSSQEQSSRRRRRRTSSSESKKRNMDSFLEELKNKHDRGEEETNSYLSLSSTWYSIISRFHVSIVSLKLQEYHSYRSCKKITRKSMLE